MSGRGKKVRPVFYEGLVASGPPNRRIFLNIAVTYGRSLYAPVCGLVVGRWLAAALGETDLGL